LSTDNQRSSTGAASCPQGFPQVWTRLR
jgi:hypothetical protein